MSDFTVEPTVGSRVDVEVNDEESWVVSGTYNRTVTIKSGDVTSGKGSSVTLDGETFEKIIEWYEEIHDPS